MLSRKCASCSRQLASWTFILQIIGALNENEHWSWKKNVCLGYSLIIDTTSDPKNKERGRVTVLLLFLHLYILEKPREKPWVQWFAVSSLKAWSSFHRIEKKCSLPTHTRWGVHLLHLVWNTLICHPLLSVKRTTGLLINTILPHPLPPANTHAITHKYIFVFNQHWKLPC